ncbi:hypothetical protein PVAP13_1NG430100 [Panicum virgatum]|uniref:Pectinesterase inhibitor domain-containing protein n=1 Tax=Panicum virgatum TaxID=38727 RepID=A0A8T0X733_PANVG|nr:hypothetical protein PVAP13_1NG430100 [Panicum virgatum]
MVQAITIILLAVAIAPGLAVGGSSVINATCAQLKPLWPYDYCVGVLSGDPAATAATDVRGVASAAVNITTTKAVSTLRLSTCREYYGNMLQSLADVRVDLDAGRFSDASFEISANASARPMDCDIYLFEGNAHKDPIQQENTENSILAGLASDILRLLES